MKTPSTGASTALAVLVLGIFSPQAAAGWTAVPVRSGLQPYVDSARVCKRTIGSPYGPLYTVNYQVFRKRTELKTIGAFSYRLTNGQVQYLHTQTNSQWLYGVVSGTGDIVYTSPFHNDNYGFEVRFSPAVWDSELGIVIGGATLAQFHPSQIADC
jgi:hypothetical protein